MSFYAQAFSDNFTGLELEDGGGRGTSGFAAHLFDWILSMDICFPFILIFMCYGKEGIINVLYKICLVI